MTDRTLLWFQCKNPDCALVHKIRDKKRQSDLPVNFLSYVNGYYHHYGFETYFESDDDEFIEINIYVRTWSDEEKEVNSYINPIKGLRYCSVCFNKLQKNENLEKYQQ